MNPTIGSAKTVLANWQKRQRGCCATPVIKGDPKNGFARVFKDCCHVPICGHEIRLKQAQWAFRGRLLEKRIRPGNSFLSVLGHTDALKEKGEQLRPGVEYGWHYVTVGIRDKRFVDGVVNINKVVRPKLKKYLQDNDAIAGAISLHIGESKGHPHLHAVYFAPEITYEKWVRWQRSIDCTKEGCKHDDIFCPGSSQVDVRPAKDLDNIFAYLSGWGNPPEKEEQRERLLMTMMLTYKQRRVTTFGLASPGMWKDGLRKEKKKKDDEDSEPPSYENLAIAHRDESREGDKYVWKSPPTFKLFNKDEGEANLSSFR